MRKKSAIGLETLLVLCFVGVGSVLAVAIHEILASNERRLAVVQFDDYLSELAFDLQRELDATFVALRSLQARFDTATTEVTRNEFSTFARIVLDGQGVQGRDFPLGRSIQAMEWVPRVRGSRRKEHETAAREAGLAGYAITHQREPGQMAPAPTRDVHYPVFFVEPLAGNEEAIGFDLGTDPARLAAVERALTTGEVTLTNPIVLVQEHEASKAVLALLRVPAGTGVPEEAEGLVVAVLRIADIVGAARADTGREAQPVRIDQMSVDEQGESQVLYRDGETMREHGKDTVTSTKHFPLNGVTWRLTGWSTEGFVSQRSTVFPVAAAAGVFALFVALGAFGALVAARSRDRALRRQDRTIRAVLGSLVEGVVVADREGKILLANETAERAAGMGASAARPGRWSDTYGCYLPDMKTPYPERDLPLARAIRGETVTDQDLYLRNPAKSEGVRLRANAAPLLDEKGDLLGGVVTLRDVTEWVKSEEFVRRLSSAVEQTADAVFITDRDGKILYVNPAFQAITGFAAEEALGKTPRILKSGEYGPEHYRKLWDTILAGNVYRATTINRRKDGELLFAEQTITPMKEHGQVTHFVSVCKDMTERRRIHELAIEMRLAAEVQQQLYPEAPLELPGLDIAGAVFSAEATCGDYYDFMRIAGGRIGVAIGDVSGHGMAAAMVMTQTRAFLRAFVHSEPDVGVILGKVNDALCRDLRSGLFVTLLLAAVDVSAGSVVYASAGHTPGHILNARGEVKRVLAGTGVLLGVDAKASYGLSDAIPLERGDVMVLVTDGVTESRSPQGGLFGDQGVVAAVRASRHEGARQIVERIQDAVTDFRAGRPQHDDITILVCKIDELSAA